MRKINVIIVIAIMILLVDHIVFGGLHLLGFNAGVMRPMAMLMLILVLAHALISMYVTLRAEKAGAKTKARYNKENREFWLRRTSGVMILVSALVHAYTMFKDENGVPRIARLPKVFSLATPLLIFSIYLHVFVNVRALLIAFGIRNINRKEKVIKVLLTVVMLFAMSALIYFNVKRSGGH